MPVEFKDYYETLGVPKTATQEQIKKAFRKLAFQHHPDRARDKKAAEEKFKDINEAYEVLGDPEKRKKYDELGANWNRPGGFTPPPGWEDFGGTPHGGMRAGGEFHFSGTGFSDFFEQFFGGRRGGFGGFPGFEFGEVQGDEQASERRGADIEGEILVTLDEAMRGSTRQVSVRHTDPRTGEVETQTYRVRIPAGVSEGQVIRLSGRGHAAIGGAAGDLNLRVKFARHPDFRARESDLYYDLELYPWQAVLGTKTTIPTLDGPAALRIPPGTTAGQQLRLQGKGLPRRDGGHGDLYAVVSIQIPSRVSSEERRLWEQLARQADLNSKSKS